MDTSERKIFRRDLLRFVGLSSGAALLAGCEEKVAPTLEAIRAIAKVTLAPFSKPSQTPGFTPTLEQPTATRPAPTFTPTPEEPSPEPTEERQKEITTTGRVEIYLSQNGEWAGYIIAGKTVQVEEWVTDEEGVVWARLAMDRWAKEGGVGGLFPPEGGTEIPVSRSSEFLDLQDVGLKIHCKGNLTWAPSRATLKEDRTIVRDDEAVRYNIERLRKYFEKYRNDPNGGRGRNLEIFFYSDPALDPFFAQSHDYGSFYRFARVVGNTVEVYLGVKGMSYSLDRMSYEFHNQILLAFLAGQDEALMENKSIPANDTTRELKSIVYPEVFSLSAF